MRFSTLFASAIVITATACGQGSIFKASLGQGGVQTNAACLSPGLGAGDILIVTTPLAASNPVPLTFQ